MKLFLMILGAAGTSLSAVFVRFSTAPSLVLVFYRVALATLLLSPVVWLRFRQEIRGLGRRELGLCVVSGAFLGIHFAAYFESLRTTSIASAVVLVNTAVLFVALATVTLLRQKLSRRAWAAVLMAFAGSVVVAMADSASGSGALWGDMLALVGAVCMAVYTMIGSVCRQKMSTTAYTFFVYLTAAVTVLVIITLSGEPLTGYGPVNLVTALGMAVFCTLLGHSVFSWGLRYFSAAFIATVKLLEPVLASVWGLALFSERPGPLVLVGGAVIIAGIALYSWAPQVRQVPEESTLAQEQENGEKEKEDSHG